MDIKTPTQQLLALLQGNLGAETTEQIDEKRGTTSPTN